MSKLVDSEHYWGYLNVAADFLEDSESGNRQPRQLLLEPSFKPGSHSPTGHIQVFSDRDFKLPCLHYEPLTQVSFYQS